MTDEVKVMVAGDWRDADGKSSSYSQELASAQIYISGGTGFFWFYQGMWAKALKEWKKDLIIIFLLEKQTNHRFHKGMFFYNIGVCYHNQGMEEKAEHFRQLALKEDQITYGEKAKDFPAQDGFNL